MYAVFEFRTNKEGIMTHNVAIKTPNPVYAQSKVYELAAAAVGSSVYIHTILCVDEHGQRQFDTPLCFEHIPEPAPAPEPEPEGE